MACAPRLIQQRFLRKGSKGSRMIGGVEEVVKEGGEGAGEEERRRTTGRREGG